MKRLFAAVAASVLAMTMLTACGGGGDDTDAYCSAIEDAKAKFKDLNNFDPSQLDDVTNTFSDIADKAPDSVKDQWATIDGGFTEMTDTLSNLGIDPADLSDPAAMASIDPQKIDELQQLASKLGSDDMSKAADDITSEVKSDCDIDLNA